MELYYVSGRSMAPLLSKGKDLVLVDDTPFINVNKYDLILFYDLSDERSSCVSNIVCHRVLKTNKKKHYVFEKGDNHFRTTIVTEKEYIGRVVAIIKEGRVIDLKCKRNLKINKCIGIISNLYLLKIHVFLFFHRNLSIDDLSVDKALRDSFFRSFRALSDKLITHFTISDIEN